MKRIRPLGMTVVFVLMAQLWVQSIRAEDASPVGTLYVTSEPTDAQVLVDGALKGVTPCLVKDVAAGNLRIVIRKPGFAEAVRQVKVDAGKLEKLKFKLLPLRDVGTIVVMVKPEGGSVYLGHSYKGKTPCKLINIKAGTYTVRVTGQGYVPYEATITVKADAEELVVGEMAPIKGESKPTTAVQAEVTAKAESPGVRVSTEEEKVFAPVRSLIQEREYDKAVKTLIGMSQQSAFTTYRARIIRDLGFVRVMKSVVDAACKALPGMVGEEMEVVLRKGIAMKGTLKEVKDRQIVLKLAVAETTVDLKDVDAVLIVRLAGKELDRTKASTQAAFGVFYASEGEYARAERALALAHGGGYDVTEARSFLSAEKALAEAEKTAKVTSVKAEPKRDPEVVAKKPEPKAESKKTPVVLIDESKSGLLLSQLKEAITKLGFEVKVQEGVDYTKLEDEVVLLAFVDKGSYAKAFTKTELEAIRRFVGKGGSLFYVGTSRADSDSEDSKKSKRKRDRRREQSAGESLMSAFGVELRDDSLDWARRVPSDMPAWAMPLQLWTTRHIIMRHVKYLWVATWRLRPSTLDMPNKADVLVVTGKYISSTYSRSTKLTMAAAMDFGKGRVFILSTPLFLGTSLGTGTDDKAKDRKRIEIPQNDGEIFILNAFKWMLHVRSTKEYGKPF